MQIAELPVAAPTTAPAPIAQQDFRDAMAGLAAAVNVITTDGPHGRFGFTATAVCSVTDSPPTLLVCLNRSASVHPALTAHATLCINTLTANSASCPTCSVARRPWLNASPPHNGLNGSPVRQFSMAQRPPLIAGSARLSASAHMTFCSAKYWHCVGRRMRRRWCISTETITNCLLSSRRRLESAIQTDDTTKRANFR